MSNLAQQQGSPNPARVDPVRRDRDRFLAFAFCAADILVELDKQCRISYIAGATLALTGKSDAQLLGRPFAGMVAPVDRTLFDELLGGLKPGRRLDPVRIRFSGPRGQAVPLLLFGYQLAEVGGAYYFALRLEPSVSGSEGRTVTLRRDAQTGLLDAESFAESASARVRGAKQKAEELSFTVLRIGDLAELRSQLGRDRPSAPRSRPARWAATARPGWTNRITGWCTPPRSTRTQ